MSKLQVSVIIPTYNRKLILGKVLDSLLAQTFAANAYEIVVADDGGNDGTEELILANRDLNRVKFTFLRQENKGPAAARNLAIRRASGELLLLLDDDVVAARNLLETHVAAHRGLGPWDGVKGALVSPPEYGQSPLLRYLERTGPQSGLRDGQQLDHQHFTPNLSVKRETLLRVGLFNERLKIGEDLDLGYRLQEAGLRLHYCQQAVAYHYDQVVTDYKSCCHRARLYGENAVSFAQGHPDYRLWTYEPACYQLLPVRALPRLVKRQGFNWQTLKWLLRKLLVNAPVSGLSWQLIQWQDRLSLRWGAVWLLRLALSYEFCQGVREGALRYGWKPDC
jgi:glycosyltransferase involved in cell wall biosynthesis